MDINTGPKILAKVGNISINVQKSEKIDIFVKLVKSLANIAPYRSYLAYETDYNGPISNLITNYFPMTYFGIKKNGTSDVDCYFKKVDGQDLQLKSLLIKSQLSIVI